MKRIPVTRKDFERNMNIAADRIRFGKQHFSETTVKLVDSLVKVRNLPNGRLNFLTVDEAARLHANHSAEMLDHFEQSIGNAKIGEKKDHGNQNAE